MWSPCRWSWTWQRPRQRTNEAFIKAFWGHLSRARSVYPESNRINNSPPRMGVSFPLLLVVRMVLIDGCQGKHGFLNSAGACLLSSTFLRRLLVLCLACER